MMRLRLQVCAEKQAPDGTWAPVMCMAGAVEPGKRGLRPTDSLEIAHQCQRAADQLIQEITRIKA